MRPARLRTASAHRICALCAPWRTWRTATSGGTQTTASSHTTRLAEEAGTVRTSAWHIGDTRRQGRVRCRTPRRCSTIVSAVAFLEDTHPSRVTTHRRGSAPSKNLRRSYSDASSRLKTCGNLHGEIARKTFQSRFLHGLVRKYPSGTSTASPSRGDQRFPLGPIQPRANRHVRRCRFSAATSEAPKQMKI